MTPEKVRVENFGDRRDKCIFDCPRSTQEGERAAPTDLTEAVIDTAEIQDSPPVVFLRECAIWLQSQAVFAKENSTHWAYRQNAENMRKAADGLVSLTERIASQARTIEALRAEKSALAIELATYKAALADAHARTLKEQPDG